MAELPKGDSTCFRVLSSKGGASWQGVALVDGVSKDRIGDFGFNDVFH